jgi:hypothetical protein
MKKGKGTSKNMSRDPNRKNLHHTAENKNMAH